MPRNRSPHSPQLEKAWTQQQKPTIVKKLKKKKKNLKKKREKKKKKHSESSANFTLNKQWTGEAKGRLKEETACLHV